MTVSASRVCKNLGFHEHLLSRDGKEALQRVARAASLGKLSSPDFNSFFDLEERLEESSRILKQKNADLKKERGYYQDQIKSNTLLLSRCRGKLANQKIENSRNDNVEGRINECKQRIADLKLQKDSIRALPEGIEEIDHFYLVNKAQKCQQLQSQVRQMNDLLAPFSNVPKDIDLLKEEISRKRKELSKIQTQYRFMITHHEY